MEHSTQIWFAIALAIYLIGWYVTVQIIKIMNPVDIEEWKRHYEESKKRKVPDINLHYIIVGLAALWFLWLIIGLVYAVYYIIKKIIMFIYNVETYRKQD